MSLTNGVIDAKAEEVSLGVSKSLKNIGSHAKDASSNMPLGETRIQRKPKRNQVEVLFDLGSNEEEDSDHEHVELWGLAIYVISQNNFYGFYCFYI